MFKLVYINLAFALILLPISSSAVLVSPNYQLHAGNLSPGATISNSANFSSYSGTVPIPGSIVSPNFDLISDNIYIPPNNQITPPVPPTPPNPNTSTQGSTASSVSVKPSAPSKSQFLFSSIGINTNSNSANVSFNTNISAQTFITYFEFGQDSVVTPFSPVSSTTHSFYLPNLKPDTVYYMQLSAQVHNQVVNSQILYFKTTPAIPETPPIQKIPSSTIKDLISGLNLVQPISSELFENQNIIQSTQPLFLGNITYTTFFLDRNQVVSSFSYAFRQLYADSVVQISFPASDIGFTPDKVYLEIDKKYYLITYNQLLNNFSTTLKTPQKAGSYNVKIHLFKESSKFSSENTVNLVLKPKVFILNYHKFSFKNPFKFLFRTKQLVTEKPISILSKDAGKSFSLWQAKLYAQKNPVSTNLNGEIMAILPTNQYVFQLELGKNSTYQTKPILVTQNLLAKNLTFGAVFNYRISIFVFSLVLFFTLFALKLRTEK